VLALFLSRGGWRALLIQVSAFTLAHTVALGLAARGVVSASPDIVEPLIALSIVYAALGNLTSRELRSETVSYSRVNASP
jgi:hypothetical protein